MQVYTASTTSEMKHNAHNENNKPIHQKKQYTQNRFKQVNWTSKNYVHVVHVVIVPLLSLYQCHCFCKIGLLTVLSRWIIQPMQYFPSYRTIILLRHIYIEIEYPVTLRKVFSSINLSSPCPVRLN